MTLVQLSLTLKVFKRFMVGMNDKFMRTEIMSPYTQLSDSELRRPKKSLNSGVRVKNELMRAEIMLPNMQHSN